MRRVISARVATAVLALSPVDAPVPSRAEALGALPGAAGAAHLDGKIILGSRIGERAMDGRRQPDGFRSRRIRRSRRRREFPPGPGRFQGQDEPGSFPALGEGCSSTARSTSSGYTRCKPAGGARMVATATGPTSSCPEQNVASTSRRPAASAFRPIYMDGRPHPRIWTHLPRHPWATGRNTLVIDTVASTRDPG